MGSYVFDIGAIKVKRENSNGEFVEPTVLVPANRGLGILNPDVSKIDVDPMANKLGSKYTVMNGNFATLPIKLDFKLPTDASLVEELFFGCGVTGSDIDGGKEFKFDTKNMHTLSFKQIAQRVTTTARGARGSFEISCDAGGAAEVSFDFKALFKEQTKVASGADDNSVPDCPSYDLVFMSEECSAYLVNGQSVHLSKFKFTLGGDTEISKDTCSLGAYTKDIKPELEIEVFDSVENEQSFNDLKNGVEFNFVIPFFDKDGVKKWEFIAPKCVAIEHSNPADGGRIKINRKLECRKVNGDDNFVIKYYS